MHPQKERSFITLGHLDALLGKAQERTKNTIYNVAPVVKATLPRNERPLTSITPMCIDKNDLSTCTLSPRCVG